MTKTNYTDGCWRSEVGTAGMLLLSILLMGCNKGATPQNQNISAEQAARQVPLEEKPDRDWSLPYQLIPLADAIIKVPTKHILLTGYAPGASESDKERLILQASIDVSQKGVPSFLSNSEATKEKQKILEGTRKTPLDLEGILMFEARKSELDFKNGSSLFNEKSVLSHLAYLGDYPTPPEMLTLLGLKAYRSKSGLRYLYFPLDPNFKKPNGEVFYLDCDKYKPDILPNTHLCRAGFFPRDRVGVSYSYSSHNLRYWKEIHQFVLNTLQFTN